MAITTLFLQDAGFAIFLNVALDANTPFVAVVDVGHPFYDLFLQLTSALSNPLRFRSLSFRHPSLIWLKI